MFVISIKSNKRKLIALLICILVLTTSLIVLINHSKKSTPKILKNSEYVVETEKQRVDYLKKRGIVVDEKSCSTADIMIPEKFSDVYKNYNSIQKKQGFNLEEFRGKSVKRYSYKVKNYPNEKQFIRANMLIYENHIIGGDVCSIKLNGFMHELKIPQS